MFWKQHDEPAPPPQPSLASLTQDLVRLQEDVARGDAAAAPAGEAAAQPEAPAADVPASRPEPAAAPPAAVPSADVEQRLAEQAAALEAQQRQLERQRQALEETQRQLARRVDEVTQRLQRPALNGDAADRSLLRQTVAWWLADGAALEPPASGVALRPHPSGKPVGLFRLLTFATLLEADAPVEDAKALFRALDGEGHLEAMATGAGDLEAVLDAAAAADAAPALTERLVHLARYRRGLERADPAALRAADARALARTLRDEVTGATLGGGLVLVLRELSAAGLAATEGLDAVAWLPSLLG